MIYKILTNVRDSLLAVGNPLAVEFTLNDINILSDPMQLRLLKLKTPFPDSFGVSDNLFECAHQIILGGDIYRVLEFCMLRNRVLEPHVTKVFPELKRTRL